MLKQWSDGVGAQVNVLTFSPLNFRLGNILRDQTPFTDVTVVVPHLLPS